MEDAAANKQLPTTVTVAAPPPPAVSAAVELVTVWALLTAFCFVFAPMLVAFILLYFHVHCTSSSVVLRCIDLPEAKATEGDVFLGGLLCRAVLQTAVAVLARLLPSRRRRFRIRHGLAYVAMAAAILGHCFYAARVRLVLTADPGYVFYRISSCLAIFVLAVGDVFIFIALLLARGGQD